MKPYVNMHRTALASAIVLGLNLPVHAGDLPDTGQSGCYNSSGSAVSCPASGARFYGQDAQYTGNAMSYTDNGNGTVTDNVTGIMWQQTTDRNGDGTINASDKLSYTAAISYCDSLSLGGYSDWQLPDITQTYSLIHFDGEDISSYTGTNTTGLVPFIDTGYFEFGFGDTSAGERLIDAQYASSTLYVSTTMNNAETMFGVNFADGRIKGYPTSGAYYVQCARNTGGYGQNSFTDNGDGTITDSSTGLMWAQDDSATTMNWEDTLAWVEQQNSNNTLGYSDWRLPNIKELQSLVDYTRSPDTTNSAAIDSRFNATQISNEAGQADYPYYWSSTTHLSYGSVPGGNAAYISFGRAIGSMNNGSTWIDVHGAGAQRSDPKDGNAADYPASHGPQGDAQRVFNYARLVRDAGTSTSTGSAYLTNISTRANVSGGANDAYAGFVVSGSGTQQVLIRGIAAVAGNGTDPNLTLLKHNGSGWDNVASNNDWDTADNAANISALSAALQLPDRNSNDAGLLMNLDAGTYSVQLSSNATAGLAVVGVDAVDTASDNPKLTNISTRANVSGGANNAFAGFVISGTGTLKVLLRGIASTAGNGTDPVLTLLKFNGSTWDTVDSNDNWGSHSSAGTISALAGNLQLPDRNSNDAGMLLDLATGVYTVQLSSNAGTGLMSVGVDALE